jgi:hypothetical protein
VPPLNGGLLLFVAGAVLGGASCCESGTVVLSRDDLWEVVEHPTAESREPRESYRLRADALLAGLERHVAEDSQDELLVAMPTGSGEFETFRVEPSEVLAPALQQKFPGLKTYRGTSLTSPQTSIRFETGPTGFRAEIRTLGDVLLLEPAGPEGRYEVRSRGRKQSQPFEEESP